MLVLFCDVELDQRWGYITPASLAFMADLAPMVFGVCTWLTSFDGYHGHIAAIIAASL